MHTQDTLRGVSSSSVDPPQRPEHFTGRLGGRFRLTEVLGQGSFGVVYRAENEDGDVVAIKQLHMQGHSKNRELLLLRDALPSSGKSSLQGTHDMHPVDANDETADATTIAPTVLPYHPNIVRLLHHYQSSHPQTSEKLLNLVLSYLPTDLHKMKRAILDCHTRRDQDGEGTTTPGLIRFPILMVQVILFQVARALTYMHHKHICHRDLKPGNILVDPASGRVQVCDLGSAKQILNPAVEKSTAYICSRYYRAPELLCGALHYGHEVDLWSLGCVAAELLRDNAKPLFRGSTSIDQMAEVFKVLGAPSIAELYALSPQCAAAMFIASPLANHHAMNEESAETDHCRDDWTPPPEVCRERAASAMTTESRAASPASNADDTPQPHSPDYLDCYDILRIKAVPLQDIFSPETPHEAIQLVAGLLVYEPQKRLTAQDVVEHHFFDALFDAVDDTAAQCAPLEGRLPRLPSGQLLPPEMYQLTEEEKETYSVPFQRKMEAMERLLRDVRS